jgi:hypothetical protein
MMADAIAKYKLDFLVDLIGPERGKRYRTGRQKSKSTGLHTLVLVELPGWTILL